jgi:hypothetical protein
MRSKSLLNAGKNRGGRLRFESLENRLCLSVSVSSIAIQGGRELRIVDNGAADTINIADQGNGHIDVTNGGGALIGSADNVKSILVEGKGGKDIVNYTLANTLTKTEKVVLNLGDGADQATVDISKGISGANLNLEVNGGDGADTIAVTLGSLTGAKEHVALIGGAGADSITVNGTDANIDATSLLALSIQGGAGADTLTSTFNGQVLGKLNFNALGNQGVDTLLASISADSGSTGTVRAIERGNKGVDSVTLNVNDNSGGLEGISTLTALHAKIFDIGAIDDLTHTDNVEVITAKKTA